jgi:hypothetical protein
MALQDAQLVSFQQITQILELTDRPGRSGVDGDSAASRKRGGHTQAAEWKAGNRRMAEFVGTEVTSMIAGITFQLQSLRFSPITLDLLSFTP